MEYSKNPAHATTILGKHPKLPGLQPAQGDDYTQDQSFKFRRSSYSSSEKHKVKQNERNTLHMKEQDKITGWINKKETTNLPEECSK